MISDLKYMINISKLATINAVVHKNNIEECIY